MTPLQKLTRLAQIERQLTMLGQGVEESQDLPPQWFPLHREKNTILDSIGNPPPELTNNPDAALWAIAMAETFPGITQEQAFPWFDGFGSAVYDKGRETGTREAIGHINAGTQGLIDCLRAIRANAQDGPVIWKLRLPDEEISIGEYITRTLKAAGLP